MKPEVLALSIVQFHKLCSEFSNTEQQHSDARKNRFKQRLMDVSSRFLNHNIHNLTEADIKDIDHNLKIFWPWATALDCKNGYTLSKETRGILDNLCKLWIPDNDKYIFAATDGDFAICRNASDWKVLADSIRRIYNVDFQSYLVTFYTPKHLKDDYLFIGTVYHEFGHFYIEYNNMADSVAQKVKVCIDNGEPYSKDLLSIWFEAINLAKDEKGNIDPNKRDSIIDSQTEEYMADLFGAQYLGFHLTEHIESNRHGRMDEMSQSHPAPNKRNQLISEFYDIDNHKSNLFLQWIVDEFQYYGKPLKKRFQDLDPSRFIAGQPMVLNNDDELHSVFHLAWKVYMQLMSPKTDATGKLIVSTIDHHIYSNINEAVRHSIANYLHL